MDQKMEKIVVRKNEDEKKVIFVVDDEEELLRSLQRPLQIKYKVITTPRSADVLDILRSERVDCRLLDVRMPGMTGIELLKEIKFTYPHIPILIMTGHGDENDTISALKYGASGYLKKPIDIYKLFDEIERITTNLKPHVTQKSPNILLVDDEEEFLKSIKKTLLNFPYTITVASNVDEAFKYFAEMDFDIVIIDIQMPNMTGLEFIDKAKKLKTDFIPIVITGVSSQELAIESIKQGVFDYIKKPFDIKDITSAIERSMNKLQINREIQLKNKELLIKEKALQDLNVEIGVKNMYLENIVKSISNMLFITDGNGIIKTVNDATLTLLGYSPEELVNLPINKLFSEEDARKFSNPFMENKNFSNLEKELLKKDNKTIFTLFSGSIIRNHSGIVEGFVFVAQDISDRKAAEEELHRLSYYDTLTNLPNRLYFEMMAGQALETAKSKRLLIAFLYIDLDGFKAINDRLGHPIGDALLKEVAKRLQSTFRLQDFVARIGGDEFVACLSSIFEQADAGIIAQRLIFNLNQPYYIENNEISIGASVGIAIFPDTATEFSQLFKNADVALYKAKYSGRNQFQYFNKQLDAEYLERLKLDNALRFALGRNELYMVYQPIYNAKTGKIAAVEALMRWHHTELGDISPQKFIPLAEYNGLIISLSEWMIETAIQKFSEWNDKLATPVNLSLNISASQLDRGDDLVKLLDEQCKKYEVSPSMLDLELTETAIMHNPQQSDKILHQLNKLGFTIALDDFGQGYSSLSLLSRLPVSILKVDKQFVGNLEDHKSEMIVRAIIGLSKSLSLAIVAEGVETKAQLDLLNQLECDFIQGYFYSKPLPEKDLLTLLQRYN